MHKHLGLALIGLVVAGCGRNFTEPSKLSQPLSLSADQSSLSALGHTQLHAAGGDGQYAFSVIDAGIGSSVGDGGVYVAGDAGDTLDTLLVTDSAGATASTIIHIGPYLRLSPSDATVSPGGNATFIVQGGTPPYQVQLAPHGNASFGSITNGGFYTAGLSANQVDTVMATDANGVVQLATVHVGPNVLPGNLALGAFVEVGDLNGDGLADAVLVTEAGWRPCWATPGSRSLVRPSARAATGRTSGRCWST